MRIKKVNSDAIKLYETSQVKLKTAGNTREVQFLAGNNICCPIQNIFLDYTSVTQLFQYDRTGNRVAKTTDGMTETYSYNAKNQLMQILSLNGKKDFSRWGIGIIAGMQRRRKNLVSLL